MWAETSLAAKLLCIPQAGFIWNAFKLKYRKNLNNFEGWRDAPLHLFIPWWNLMDLPINQGFPSASGVKNLPAMQETQETRFWSLGQKIPWRRAWQPTPVFLPGKSHGQRPGRMQFTGLKRVGHDWACTNHVVEMDMKIYWNTFIL